MALLLPAKLKLRVPYGVEMVKTVMSQKVFGTSPCTPRLWWVSSRDCSLALAAWSPSSSSIL